MLKKKIRVLAILNNQAILFYLTLKIMNKCFYIKKQKFMPLFQVITKPYIFLCFFMTDIIIENYSLTITSIFIILIIVLIFPLPITNIKGINQYLVAKYCIIAKTFLFTKTLTIKYVIVIY